MENRKDMQTRLVPGVGRLPYPAYRGQEPYIFISYARLDSERVLAEIKRFNEAGYHVWYDEGIAPGNEWSDAIAEALSKCSAFVVMLTPTSAPRENVLNEIDFALNERKPFLAIYLDKTELTPGLKLRISRKQAILRYNMSEEEYEYKFIEAFTGFGLVRNDAQVSAQPRVITSAFPSAKESVVQSPAAVPSSPVIAGTHPFGDYVAKGTAVITNGLGKEFTAIGNSLVYKPAGQIAFQTLHNLISMEKSLNGYLLIDATGRETLLKTSPGDELWFLSAEEKTGIGQFDPEKLQINMVKSIHVDPDRTPARKIRYCDVRMKDGSFKTPCEFLFFSVNENNGTPPMMKLKKDLNQFSGKGYASLLMMKKIIVKKPGETPSPYGDHRSLEIEVQYPGDDADTFTIDDYFAVYAMAAGGEVHELNREELSEIEML